MIPVKVAQRIQRGFATVKTEEIIQRWMQKKTVEN
jgi:hypothetical protein